MLNNIVGYLKWKQTNKHTVHVDPLKYKAFTMMQTTYTYKNISTWSDCTSPVGENWMLTTRTSGFQWRLLMSPFLTPGRLILCPFLSPSPWSTKDKLPHSVIFFLSRYSYKICHQIKILKKKRSTLYLSKAVPSTDSHLSSKAPSSCL